MTILYNIYRYTHGQSISYKGYIYIYIYIWGLFNKLSEFCLRKHCFLLDFFKEINSNSSFHITENCKQDLLYSVLHMEFFLYLTRWVCPRGVMVKAMDCEIVVSEFVLQSRYYVHFWTNSPWERYEPPYPPSYGLNSTTTILQGE